jgi:hypothetical protein
MWIPAATKAAEQGNAKGLHKPPGYEAIAYTVHHFARSDWTVRWSLSHRTGRGRSATIATWITDWLPDEQRVRPTACTTHGKVVWINQRPTQSSPLARAVRVLIDGDGLPVPVPEPIWATYEHEEKR